MVDLSYSTISYYLQCPRKVYYKLQGIRTSTSYPLLYGSAWHEILERTFKGEEVNIEKIVKSYFDGSRMDRKELWDGTIRQGKKDWQIDSMCSWLEDAVRVLLDTGIRPSISELWLEREFPTFNLRGRIDAFVGNGIIDFKLTKGYYDQYKKRNVYDVDFLQGVVYSLLNRGPVPFHICVMFREMTPRVQIIPIPEAEDEHIIDWCVTDVIEPVADAIQKGVFPASPGYKWCSSEYCNFWGVCRGRK